MFVVTTARQQMRQDDEYRAITAEEMKSALGAVRLLSVVFDVDSAARSRIARGLPTEVMLWPRKNMPAIQIKFPAVPDDAQ